MVTWNLRVAGRTPSLIIWPDMVVGNSGTASLARTADVQLWQSVTTNYGVAPAT